ncbi:MAG: DUF2817 domain-containing protein [Bdellovibrionales bacterium]|nr:DUF2817 domain-containing protein [Bdellovibrionales bacterium]
MADDDLKYYPANYADSRRQFLQRAHRAPSPCEVGKWLVPSPTDNDLSVDYLWLPPTEKSETLFVINSGIHGSESYTGASQQFMFMDEILPRIDRRHCGILLVHAMNPYGYKNHRRCTEGHVNLNRNFSVSGEIFRLRNPDAARLQERYIPREAVTSLRSPVLKSLAGNAMDEFAKAVGPGQFENQKDLEFGGFGPEPQTKEFIDYIKNLMPAYRDVVVFDIHTGLGDRARLHLLREDAPETLHPELFAKLFDPNADRDIYDFTPPEAEGFYTVYGAMNGIFGELATPQQRVCALTMEFGTLGHSLDQQVEAFNRWIVDHQGQFYGYASPDLAKEAIRLNFERSFPSDESWRRAVLIAARRLFNNTFARAGFLN